MLSNTEVAPPAAKTLSFSNPGSSHTMGVSRKKTEDRRLGMRGGGDLQKHESSHVSLMGQKKGGGCRRGSLQVGRGGRGRLVLSIEMANKAVGTVGNPTQTTPNFT